MKQVHLSDACECRACGGVGFKFSKDVSEDGFIESCVWCEGTGECDYKTTIGNLREMLNAVPIKTKKQKGHIREELLKLVKQHSITAFDMAEIVMDYNLCT